MQGLSYPERLTVLKLYSVQRRRERYIIIYVWKILECQVPNFSPPIHSRTSDLFYKINNGLAQVPFEGVLVEAYKGTRRKHNMKFRQTSHTTSQYGQ